MPMDMCVNCRQVLARVAKFFFLSPTRDALDKLSVVGAESRAIEGEGNSRQRKLTPGA